MSLNAATTTVTVSLVHLRSDREQPCAACGAPFVPSEDSGSRVLTIKSPDGVFTALMCGGCHSKWSHGTTMRFRGNAPTHP